MRRLNSLGLSTKIIALAVALLVAVVGVNYAVFVRGYAREARRAMAEKAAAFTAVADEAKNHASRLVELGAFDSVRLSAEAAEHVREHGSGSHKDTHFFQTVPVIAGWRAAQDAAAREGIDFRIVALEARNPDNEPTPGSFSAELLAELIRQAGSGGPDVLSRVDERSNALHYMRAIRLGEACLSCHGEPGHPIGDPDGDGFDLLGFPMERWAAGHVHGAYEVVMPLDAADAQVAGFFRRGMLFTAPVVAAGVLLFVAALVRLVTRPVRTLIEMMREIATGDGDLTKRLRLDRADEIGQLGRWVDAFLDGIHALVSDVRAATEQVAGSATEIAGGSEQMAAGLREQQRETDQVAAAVEQMSRSVAEVAEKSASAVSLAQESGREAADGGGVVRRTIEEMSAISELVHGSAEAVRGLGARGEQIGAVIGVINDIADQTNLLALNAAIEAARAGEHGRGFAVVASEVRKLADRTTQATEEISRSIRAIQEDTERAVARIDASTEGVRRGVDLASTAGAALERIEEGSASVQGVVHGIAAAAAQQAAAGEEIARAVTRISAVSHESTAGAAHAAAAAANLSRQAEHLEELVRRFRL